MAKAALRFPAGFGLLARADGAEDGQARFNRDARAFAISAEFPTRKSAARL